MVTRRPIGLPSRTGITVTVTSSPGFNVSLLHPLLIMSGGLLVSTTQCSTSPLSFLESNFRKQWGLAQNHCVTVAFIVSFLSVLNAAAPWCANIGIEIANK